MNSTKDNDEALAEVPVSYARMAVRDLIQRAYDAGYLQDGTRPSAEEVNAALASLEKATKDFAHWRMEETAKRCGFDGVTAALGYVLTLGSNPLAALLDEARNLAIVGDIYPSEDKAECGGWSYWLHRVNAVLGVKPNEVIAHAHDNAVQIEPQVLSGCAVRAAIQREQTGDAAADAWDYYGLPRTRCIGDVPVYYWNGRNGRYGKAHRLADGLPTGAEHVVVDESRGDPSGPAPVCRIVESVEPLSLGHTLVISREELQPLGDNSWTPEGGTTTSKH